MKRILTFLNILQKAVEIFIIHFRSFNEIDVISSKISSYYHNLDNMQAYRDGKAFSITMVIKQNIGLVSVRF